MLQKYFTKFFLFIFSLGIVFPADADAPFGSILLHHVVNDINKIYVPIHIGGLDLSITKHVILVLVIGLITVLMGIIAASKYKKNNNKVPSKFSGLFEVLVEFINKRIDRTNGKISDFIYKIDEISLKRKKPIDFKIIKEALEV